MKIILLALCLSTLWCARLSKDLQNELSSHSSLDVIIKMKDFVNFDHLKHDNKHLDQLDPSTRGRVVYNALVQLAEESQRNVKRMLDASNMRYKSYWVNNIIHVRNASQLMINSLLQRPEIEVIDTIGREKVFFEPSFNRVAPSNESIEYNIKWIKAPLVWKHNITGHGITVGNIDAGVNYKHPDLYKKYRGYLGDNTEPKHDYNWWDGVREGSGGGCQSASKFPCDDHGHGTHTMGTIVGSGKEKITGVAPGARWIACRGFDRGYVTINSLTECLQYFVAPTKQDGSNPDPDKRPHSASHSYGVSEREGVYKRAYEAMHASGIAVIASAGNWFSCNSVNRLPGMLEVAFTIGAHDKNSEEIATFSSKGPVTEDGSNRIKPDICAPGVEVVSTARQGGYTTMSGTSMSSPAVNGAVALLWEANPKLIRDLKRTYKIMEKSARKRPSTMCSKPGGPEVPNNVYGWGNLDVYAAWKLAVEE